MKTKDEISLCDACGVEIPSDEAHTCDICRGAFCEKHIGSLDHECEEEEEEEE